MPAPKLDPTPAETIAEFLKKIAQELDEIREQISELTDDQLDELQNRYAGVTTGPTGPEAIRPLVERLTESNERIKKAAVAIYEAAYWETDSLPKDEQLKLWEELRDALGLPAGTATAIGVGPEPIGASPATATGAFAEAGIGMSTQAESDNAARTKVPGIPESPLSESQDHPNDAALLDWAAECPRAAANLAKISERRLRSALCLWQEAGCPDLAQWRERYARQERSPSRESRAFVAAFAVAVARRRRLRKS